MSLADSIGPPERRDRRRYRPLQERICFIDSPDGNIRAARIVDFTRCGVRLQMSRHIPIGPTYVGLPSRGRTRVRLLNVLHTEEDKTGWWHLGGAFVPPLRSHELKSALQSLSRTR